MNVEGGGETEARLGQIVAHLREQQDVGLVYLFGSHARGRTRPGSDRDLALLVDEQHRTAFDLMERRLDLAAEVEELVRHPVDVILLNRASLFLQGKVLREGGLLYARDKAEQVEYEATARALYFDFQPRLRHHHEVLLRGVREGHFGNH